MRRTLNLAAGLVALLTLLMITVIGIGRIGGGLFRLDGHAPLSTDPPYDRLLPPQVGGLALDGYSIEAPHVSHLVLVIDGFYLLCTKCFRPPFLEVRLYLFNSEQYAAHFLRTDAGYNTRVDIMPDASFGFATDRDFVEFNYINGPWLMRITANRFRDVRDFFEGYP